MRESATYQAILAEGRAEGEARGIALGEARVEARAEARGVARGRMEEAHRMLHLIGDRRFGDPSEWATAELARLDDLERIERIAARLLEATSWDDLLATP